MEDLKDYKAAKKLKNESYSKGSLRALGPSGTNSPNMARSKVLINLFIY
jgi:hypothetical protein